MIKNLKQWDNGGPAPPFSEVFKNDAVTDELEAENRADLLNEVNQARLAEFLATAGSDEPDIAALEVEDRANQQYPYYQEQFQDFVQAMRDEEEMMRESPFWSMPSPAAASPPPTPAMPATVKESPVLPVAHDGVPPPRGPTPKGVCSGAGGPNHITPYQAMEWLVRQGKFLHAGGLLYLSTGKAYLPCKREEAKKKILESCRSAVELSGSARFVNQIYELLLIEPRICRDADLFANFVAFEDGVLDLNSGQFQPHNPAKFVTTQFAAGYRLGRSSSCPNFDRFLHEVACGDPVCIQRIWECLGYLLVPDQAGKKFVLFQGVTNSGKSVLGNFIRDCFVGDVTTSIEINDFRGNFTLADLVGRKLCFDMDLPSDPLNAKALGKLKKMTGGDSLSSDVKFSDRVNFICAAKFLFGSNHAILLKESDPAFLNRLVVVPFHRSFNGADQDHDLPRKLAAERSAIIVRAIEAYQQLRRNGFQFAGNFQVNQVLGCDVPDSVEDAVADFLRNGCEPAENVWTPTEKLYATFVQLYGPRCEKARFSELLFLTAASQNFQILKKRERLTPASNPIYGFCGLRIKERIE